MAIQWCEGFDLTTLDTLFGWNNGSVATIIASGGRISGGRMSCVTTGVNQNGRAIKLLSTASDKVGVCFGYWSNGAVGTGGVEPYNIIRFAESSTYHVGLRFTGVNQTIKAYRAGDSSTLGTLIATGTQLITGSEWHHIEVWVEIADASGRVKVYVDNNPTPDIDFTGDTQDGATGQVDRVGFGHTTAGGGGNVTHLYDDIVVYDDSGGVNDTAPLGDLRVITKMPDGAGTTTQGTPLSSTNFSNMDETTMDSDTSYVEFSTIGHKDTYNMTALGVTGTVLAVQNRAAVRKTDAGPRAAKPVLRFSGTEVDGTEEYLNLTYRYLTQMHNTKPGGGSWSVSDVDATEAGVKMTA